MSVDHTKAFTPYKAKASKHRITWPSQRSFELASQFVRAGTERHLAAALMLGGKPTMEQIEAISGTDADGYRVYGFTPPKNKKR